MEFLVFPDSPVGEHVAGPLVVQDDVQVVRHPSGRPWVVGRWRADEIVLADEADRGIVLLGCPSIPVAALRSALRNLRDLSTADRLAGSVTGSFHLLVTLHGHVRAQGTISAVRQLFHTEVHGTTVLADQPQTLAALSGGGLDETAAVCYLPAPRLPWPIDNECPWRGIGRVPPDSWVRVAPDGQHRITRWWSPPEPVESMRSGADGVRHALTDAVAARTRSPGRVSADLSGGMDSTSLCFLLAPRTDGMLTTRFESVDPANDDGTWAARAAADLPDAEHLVHDRDSMPMNMSGALDPDPDAEAPFPWIRTRDMLAYKAQVVAGKGATTHLTGNGGDELFYVLPWHDHSLVRTSPLRYVRQMRANRHMRRWSVARTVRYLVAGTPYQHWLEMSARALTAPQPETWDPSLGWGEPPRMPPWTTRHAVEAARALVLTAAAGTPEPLAPLRAQHATLQAVRVSAEGMRRGSRLTSRHGVDWHAPFLDDRVIEAALSVHLAHRVAADRYKPVLAQAMRGVVPDDVLARPTKGEFSADLYAGFRHHKQELLDECAEMMLGEQGLVDVAAFRAALLAPHPTASTLIPLMTTLACEGWLRSVAAMRSLTPLARGR